MREVEEREQHSQEVTKVYKSAGGTAVRTYRKRPVLTTAEESQHARPSALEKMLAARGEDGALDMCDAINEFFDHLITIVKRHGGDIIKFAGTVTAETELITTGFTTIFLPSTLPRFLCISTPLCLWP